MHNNKGFNDIWDPCEKKGGVLFNWHKSNIFNTRINQCSLMEVEAQGGQFTWKGVSLRDTIDYSKSLIEHYVIWNGG